MRKRRARLEDHLEQTRFSAVDGRRAAGVGSVQTAGMVPAGGSMALSARSNGRSRLFWATAFALLALAGLCGFAARASACSRRGFPSRETVGQALERSGAVFKGVPIAAFELVGPDSRRVARVLGQWLPSVYGLIGRHFESVFIAIEVGQVWKGDAAPWLFLELKSNCDWAPWPGEVGEVFFYLDRGLPFVVRGRRDDVVHLEAWRDSKGRLHDFETWGSFEPFRSMKRMIEGVDHADVEIPPTDADNRFALSADLLKGRPTIPKTSAITQAALVGTFAPGLAVAFGPALLRAALSDLAPAWLGGAPWFSRDEW